MTYNASIARSLVLGGVSVGATEEQSATGQFGFNKETVADGQTDQVIQISIDVSAVKAFILISDQAVTIETNAVDATGGNTIVLVANKPYIFVVNDYVAFLLTLDVTVFYVTNASGSTATISCQGIYDATPYCPVTTPKTEHTDNRLAGGAWLVIARRSQARTQNGKAITTSVPGVRRKGIRT